jgi:hypothetical protein
MRPARVAAAALAAALRHCGPTLSDKPYSSCYTMRLTSAFRWE